MHVVCALIMYVLWWYKPQDIGEPFVLFEDIADACLYALASARIVIESTGPQETYPVGTHHTKIPSSVEKITVMPDEHSVVAGSGGALSEEEEELLVGDLRPPEGPGLPQEPDNKVDFPNHPNVILGVMIINQVLKLSREDTTNRTSRTRRLIAHSSEIRVEGTISLLSLWC